MTLGLLSIGVLVGVTPVESVSFPPVLATRHDLGVLGEVLCRASEDPFLRKFKYLSSVMIKEALNEITNLRREILDKKLKKTRYLLLHSGQVEHI
jgi:hypothetical protein